MEMAGAGATGAFGGGLSASDFATEGDDGETYTPPVAPEGDGDGEAPGDADGGAAPTSAFSGEAAAADDDEYVPPVAAAGADGGEEDLEEGEVTLG